MPSITARGPLSNSSTPPATAVRSAGSWAGRAMSSVVILLLAFDSLGKLFEVAQVIDGAARLGYPTHVVFGLGATLLACVVVYSIPATSLLGAILLTGYLGGAVATHVRVGSPLFTHVLVPVYVAALAWGGLFLRDARVRTALGRQVADRSASQS